MEPLSLGNINKPTSAYWSKVAAVFALASTTLSGGGTTYDTHWVIYISTAFSFIAGAILILTNGKR